MAFLQLRSNNPKLSYLIAKNPSSGMLFRSIRKGYGSGWFSQNDTCYNIFFKDEMDAISYGYGGEDGYEFLDTTRFNSAMFVNNAIQEYFRSCFKLQEDDKEGYNNEVFINMINITNKNYVNFFKQYFTDTDVEFINIIDTVYSVRIKTNKSIYYLMNFVAVFGIMVSMSNIEEKVFVQDDLLKKYINSINVINAPYFIRYLFKARFLFNKSDFDKFKESLELPGISLTYGDNFIERKRFVKSCITPGVNIFDVGCGEGNYLFDISKKMDENLLYLGVDTDKEVIESVAHKVKKRELNNVVLFDSVKDAYQSPLFQDNKYQCILTEVLEHLEFKDAVKLLKGILENDNITKVIVTTPNFNFNENYHSNGNDLNEDGTLRIFRHNDHKFELKSQDFYITMQSLIVPSKYKLSFYGVGDSVNDVYTTNGCIIEKVLETK